MSGLMKKELVKLKEHLLVLGSAVENNLQMALKAVRSNDPVLARSVINNDKMIDEAEVNVEDECTALLALQQPVASDLRFIVTALKINIDLERIGDLAVKLVEKIDILFERSLPSLPYLTLPLAIRSELDRMIGDTVWMLNSALDSFSRADRDLAFQVIRTDERVDQAKNLIRTLLEENHGRERQGLQDLALLLSITRSLERIADHATNICEDVIYMLGGEIVRHRGLARLLPEPAESQ